MLIEAMISLFFTLDFILKLKDPLNYLENPKYGLTYLIIDIIAGPASAIHDLLFLLLFSQISNYGFLMRFSKVFVLPSIRELVGKISKLIPKVLSIFIAMFTIYYIFSHLAKILYSENFPQFFGTLGTSFFTMFQILTLDSWSNIVGTVMHEKGMGSAIFFSVYVFIMTFYFLNILIGFIVYFM